MKIVKAKNTFIATSIIATFCLILGVVCSFYYAKNIGNSPNATLNMSTTVANHNFESIIDHSDAIISGTVSEVSEFTFIENNIYKTQYVTISVKETLKGALAANNNAIIEINSYDGVNNVTVEDSYTTPQFATGDNVMVFLVDNGKGGYYVTGINQGAFFTNENVRTDNPTYSHKTIIGNDLESFSRLELLEKIREGFYEKKNFILNNLFMLNWRCVRIDYFFICF